MIQAKDKPIDIVDPQVKVEQEKISGQAAIVESDMIRDSGRAFEPQGFRYVGSAAFHVYHSDIVGPCIKVVTPIGSINEMIASYACKLLAQECKKLFRDHVNLLKK